MKYVIIGNSAAGIGTVEGIRRVDAEGSIMLISDEPYHTYSRPLISYYLAGKVEPDKMYYREADFYERANVTVRLGIKVNAIYPEQKTIVLDNGESIPYEKLMLATGGKSIIPEMPGLSLKGVFSFLKWDDVKNIQQYLNNSSKVVIIGAGLIGLKAAESLLHLGIDTSVVELSNRVLSAILDEDAAGIVKQKLEDEGLTFYLNNTVKEIKGTEHVSSVILQDGRELECDAVIIAIGVSPNHELAVQAGLRINKGIVVDQNLQTSSPDIYAAGDVAEGYDILYQQQRVLPILPNAYKQGMAAGQNMAGAEKCYEGGFAMNAIAFFGLPMITAGIIKPDSPGFDELVKVDPTHHTYKKIVLKDNKLVGFIALTEVDRAGILTKLMAEQIDVGSFQDKLLFTDFGYAHLPKEFRDKQLLGV